MPAPQSARRWSFSRPDKENVPAPNGDSAAPTPGKPLEVGEGPSYYEVLGVSPQASAAEVRNAYKRLAFQLHPDRRGPEGDGDKDDAAFSAVVTAHDVLVDPVRREMYDMLSGLKATDDDQYRAVAELQATEAERAVSMMAETVKIKRAQEEAVAGLLITRALYGDLSTTPPRAADVTVPLQCLVEDSKLIVPAGASKARLDGVFAPVAVDDDVGVDKRLRVEYVFSDREHVVEVGDEEALRIPMRAHSKERLEKARRKREARAQAEAAAQAEQAVEECLGRTAHERSRRRNRRIAVALLAAVCAGVYVARNPATVAKAMAWVRGSGGEGRSRETS